MKTYKTPSQSGLKCLGLCKKASENTILHRSWAKRVQELNEEIRRRRVPHKESHVCSSNVFLVKHKPMRRAVVNTLSSSDYGEPFLSFLWGTGAWLQK